VSVPGLLYGPDPGYQPLRESISKWIWGFQHPEALEGGDPERICITGGASQNLACLLQVFSDPAVTRGKWFFFAFFYWEGNWCLLRDGGERGAGTFEGRGDRMLVLGIELTEF